MLILDVTIPLENDKKEESKENKENKENKEWLPITMNWQLNLFDCIQNAYGTLIPKPCGKFPKCGCLCYTKQVFKIKHSHSVDFGDTSKVCYRVICSNSLRDRIVPDSVMNVKQVIDPEKYYGPERDKYPQSNGSCRYSGNDQEADGFNINLTMAEISGQSD